MDREGGRRGKTGLVEQITEQSLFCTYCIQVLFKALGNRAVNKTDKMLYFYRVYI